MTNNVSKIVHKIYEQLYLDRRSLVFFRICLGVVVLLDIGVRSTDLTLFYTDNGVLPSSAWSILNQSWHKWTFHTYFTSIFSVSLLFVIHAIIIFFFLFGKKVKLMNLALIIFQLSLQNRNYLVNNGGDDLIIVVLIWALFLPLKYTTEEPYKFKSPGALGYILQLSSIYCFSAIIKMGSWHTGDALINSMYIENLTNDNVNFLLQFPIFLKVLNFLVYYQEMFLWVLLFIPSKKHYLRSCTVLAFIGLHIGIYIFFEIGMFPIFAVVAWLPLIPYEFWDSLKTRKLCKFEKYLTSINEPSYPGFFKSPFYKVSVVLLIVFVLLSNFERSHIISLPRKLKHSIELFGLSQKWGLFKNPQPFSSWSILRAELYDGRVLDLLKDDYSYTEEKPLSISEQFSNHRQRKFSTQVRSYSKGKLKYYSELTSYCKYLIEKWNEGKPKEEWVKAIEYKMMRFEKGLYSSSKIIFSYP